MMILAWAGATVLSVLVASAAVGAVRGRVADEPHAIAVVTTSLGAPETAETVTTSSTVPPQTSTTVQDPSSVTLPPATTTTSIPPATTTTATTPAATGQIKTYTTHGGTVSIEVFADRIVLLGAVPSAGYTVAEKDISPRRIEIEFKSGDSEVEFKAVLEDDGLAVDLGADDGEGDDGDH